MGDDGEGQLSPLFSSRAIRWDRRAGAYRVNLDPGLRRVLTELMEQMLAMMDDPGAPVLHRLFPPAYSDPHDVALQDEYRRLMQDDLAERRREECRLVMETASAETLTEEQLMAWSRAVNGIRLTLGTYLDVNESETATAPTSPEESAYHWLSYLLEETVQALSDRS